jgi:hypothetical protein
VLALFDPAPRQAYLERDWEVRVARYYVVLEGPGLSNPYVIAEVVREAVDDGRFRDTSMAGNLAGFRAVILTEDELNSLDGGSQAFERWRSGNDTTFGLDDAAQEKGIAETTDDEPGANQRVEEATAALEWITQRLNAALTDADDFRIDVRDARKELQKAIEADHSTERPPTKRHLRSVS